MPDDAADVKTRAQTAVAEGQVKDVKWKLYIDPSAKKVSGSYKVLNSTEIAKVNGYIREAITKILNLGFELKDKTRVIPYYYVSDNNRWGYFSQGLFSDKDSWIGISVENLLARPDNTLAPRSTLIHETFHYFQSDYDPRCAFDKKGGAFGTAVDNENILYEMGAVWMEQWMRDGNLDRDFLKQEFADVFEGDKLGFGLEEQRWGLGKHDSNQKQGYTMAPYLYYLTKEWNAIFDKKSVLELHKLWREKWKSSTYNAYYIFYEWVKVKHDVYLLDYTDIDNYYLKFLTGELVKDFDMRDLSTFVYADNVVNQSADAKRFDFTGKCYPYGCAVQKVVVSDFEGISLKDKQMVITQENPNVHTYLVWIDRATDKYKRFTSSGEPYAVTPGDSIVISGEELEKQRGSTGRVLGQFFLITTNTGNTIHSTKVNPYHTVLEFRGQATASVTPTSLTFPAEGGTQQVQLTSSGYKRFGFNIDSQYTSWLSGKAVQGGVVEVTAQPNTTGQERTGYVKCYLTNEQSPTEAQKKYIGNVKVTQEAGGGTRVMPPVMVDVSVHLKSYRVDVHKSGGSTRYKSSIVWSQYFDQYRRYAFNITDNQYEFIEMNTDQYGTHFKCYITYTQGESTHSTVTFDLDDLDGLANGTAVIRNLQCEYDWSQDRGVDYMQKSRLSYSAELKQEQPLCLFSGPYDHPGWDGVRFIVNGYDVHPESAEQKLYYKGSVEHYSDGLIPDPEDKIKVFIAFLHDATAASVPRHRAPLLAPSGCASGESTFFN